MVQIAHPIKLSVFSAALATVATLMTGAMAPNAEAAIQCRGTAQVIPGGGLHVTPYCEDHNLAVVAQKVGSKYSFRQIRTNPNLKQELCHLLAGDIRIGSACAGLEGIEGDSRGR